MAWKLLTGVIAVVLMIAYVLPLAIKLKELSLAVVVLIGIVMMLIDMYQTMKSSDH